MTAATIPTDHRAREVLAGSWILAHTDGRKLSHHTDEGVEWALEGDGWCIDGVRQWANVLADMEAFNTGAALPA